jgi:hypothetical protein
MNRISTAVLGALLISAASVAHAQTQVPQTGGTIQGPPATYPGQLSEPANPEPRPLFSIGRLPVGVWAPVAPTYDETANRNGAGDPFWAGVGWGSIPPPG